MTCNKCGEKPKKSCGAFPKAVIEIDNPEKITLMRRVVIPTSMGDDTAVPPAIGKYHNVLLYYEANQKSYLYSSDGIPTQLVNGLTDYEAAINLPQINGVTVIGEQTSADLKLADAPIIINIAEDNYWSCDKTMTQIYDAFNAGTTVILDFGTARGEGTRSWPVHQLGYNADDNLLLGVVVYAQTQNAEEFAREGGYGLFTLRNNHTAELDDLQWQRHISVLDYTGLRLDDSDVLFGVPATDSTIGMVKPGDGLEVDANGTMSISDIEQYAHFFDTVADMKAATNLVAGDYARTGGFHILNDGGEAYYKITDTGTANEMDVIAVGDLYASLCRDDIINPIMFGAVGDGTTDDSLNIQQCFLFAKNNSVDTIEGLNKTYTTSDVIDLPNTMSSVGEKGLYLDYGVTIRDFSFVLKDGCAALTSVLNVQIPLGKQTIIDNIAIDGNCTNQSTDVGTQDGGLHGIRIGKISENNGGIIVRNCYVHDCYSDCIVVRQAKYDFVLIDNCRIVGAGRNGITDNSYSSLVENTIFTDNGYRTAPKSGYHIEADFSYDFGEKTIKNCIIDYTGDTITQATGGLNVYFNASDYTIKELNIIDCEIDKLNINSSNNGNIKTIKSVNLINSKFGGKYHWIGKTESASKLEFENINIDNCSFSRYLVIQGSMGANKPDVCINNTNFEGNDTTLELYFGMDNVEITNCRFWIDSPLASDGANCNCINSNFTDNSTVYTINNLVIENCASHNYWRLLDNHTYSAARTGKTIGNVKLINNVYETTGGGKLFYNWNGGSITKCIIDGNMLSSTTSTSKKFEPGTCAYVIGVNNICEFPTSQGFDVTGATKSIVANNLFSDT